MADHSEWEQRAKGLLKAEIKRRHLTYGDVSEKLSLIGVVETEANIKNKISRGKFSAVFLLQCLSAIGAEDLRLN